MTTGSCAVTPLPTFVHDNYDTQYLITSSRNTFKLPDVAPERGAAILTYPILVVMASILVLPHLSLDSIVRVVQAESRTKRRVPTG